MSDGEPLEEKWPKLVDALGKQMDSQKHGFSDAVVISGIDARQLRNGLERQTLQVGQKLAHVGRWEFSLRDCLHLMVVRELTTQTWMPVSAAAEIAAIVANSASSWLHLTGLAFREDSASAIVELIAYADEGRPAVLIHRRGGEWGFYNLSGERTEARNFQEAHVRLPAVGLIIRLTEGLSLANGNSGGD